MFRTAWALRLDTNGVGVVLPLRYKVREPPWLDRSSHGLVLRNQQAPEIVSFDVVIVISVFSQLSG